MSIFAHTPRHAARMTIREIEQVLRGKSSKLSMQEAIELLGAKRSKIKHRLLCSVLEDHRQAAADRYCAAMALGKEKRAEHQKVLLDNLKMKDNFVLAGVLRALAHVGGEDALRRIEKIRRRDPTGEVERAAELAKTLIAHRLGQTKHALAMPRSNQMLDVDPAGTVPVTVRAARAADVKTAVADLKKEPLAIDPSAKSALEIRVGEHRLWAVFDRRFDRPAAWQALSDANGLPAVLCHKEHCPASYFISNYVLTHPAGRAGEFNITVIRPRGRLMYAGQGTWREEGRIDFWLRGVKQHDAKPLDVQGSYAPQQHRLQLSQGLAGTSRYLDKKAVIVPRPAP